MVYPQGEPRNSILEEDGVAQKHDETINLVNCRNTANLQELTHKSIKSQSVEYMCSIGWRSMIMTSFSPLLFPKLSPICSNYLSVSRCHHLIKLPTLPMVFVNLYLHLVSIWQSLHTTINQSWLSFIPTTVPFKQTQTVTTGSWRYIISIGQIQSPPLMSNH